MHVHPNKTTVALRTVAVFEAAKGLIVLLLGVLTVIGTFVSDLILMWIDPRIRMERR